MNASALREELQKTFVPLVRSAGFERVSPGASPFMEFRRGAGAVVHVLEVQWEKYGLPRFVINYGTCPSSGIDVHGKHFAPAEVSAGWLPDGGRLQPRRGATTASWFRQDHSRLATLLLRTRPRSESEVVAEAVHLFAELETYWGSGASGEHMQARPPSFGPCLS
jgi:hypothetical protein